MADSQELRIIITADDKAAPVLQRSKGDLSNLGGAIEQLTGVSLTGIGAIMAVGAGLKFCLDEAAGAERQLAATNAVIKSTGGAAGVSAEDIQRYANRLMNLTGIGDDVIGAGENMLLTFRHIGADVFPQATQAMVDMAVAMNKGSTANIDFQATAIQIGKALDIQAGDAKMAEASLSALSRVGVRFTEDQKAMLVEMVKVGDVAGYQKGVLNELEVEFGGMAEAMGATNVGKIEKAKMALAEMGEEIGGVLLPILGEAAQAATVLINWNSNVADVLQQHNTEVLNTSVTYEEYIAEMQRAYAATGELIDSQGRAILGYTEENNEVVAITGKQMALTAEEYQHARALEAMTAQTKLYSDAEQERTVAVIAATMTEKEFNAEMKDLSFLLAGPVGKETTDYTNKQETLRKKLSDISTELGKLQGAQGAVASSQTKNEMSADELALAQAKVVAATDKLNNATQKANESDAAFALRVAALRNEISSQSEKLGNANQAVTKYVDNSKKIGELKSEYADVNKAIEANATAHETATRRILFDIMQQRIAQSGLSGEDLFKANRMLADMATRWGLVDAATARAVAGMDAAIGGLAADGSWDTIAMKMQNIANAADTARIAMFSVTGEGGSQAALRREQRQEATSGGGAIPQAAGGDWVVTRPTTFVAGEAGPERATFTPLQGGAPTNNYNNGGNVTINVQDPLTAAWILDQGRRRRLGRMTEQM